MNINCVIRNIPNNLYGELSSNALRLRGVHTRKRGRGARATPYNRIAGGEWQDLPMDKAVRFSMYFYPAKFSPLNNRNKMYFDYVGVTANCKMIIRAGK